MRNIHDSIIIGGGIAGLTCAQKLQKKGCDFVLITENIGGRITESKDGRVNYGAIYVRSDYHHVLPFVKKIKRIRINDIAFHDLDTGKSYTFLGPHILKHPIEALRFLVILKKFFKLYKKFKIRSEKIGSKKALEENNWLFRLHMMSAETFVKEHKFEHISRDYLEKILYGTAFISPRDATSFMLLAVALPLITPIYRFKFLKDKATSSFGEKIHLGTVTSIEKNKEGTFLVKTKKETFFTKNLVVATPAHITKSLLHLSKINSGVNVYMFHVKGIPQKIFQKKPGYAFGPQSASIGLLKELDDSYLFYSTISRPDFKRFFSSYKIIDQKYWEPAFYTKGNFLIDIKQKDNLFIIGDHNVCGLEDSAISGIYASNEISKHCKRK